MSAILVISQVIFSLLFIGSLFTNLLILYVIVYYLRKQNKASNVTVRCIKHIVLSDILLTCGYPMMISALTRYGWTQGTTSCRFYLSVLTSFPIFAKTFLMTVLGVVCWALHQGSAYGMTDLRVTIMITVAWILSASVSLPIYLFANVPDSHSCNIYWPENIYLNDAYVLMQAICVFALPLAVGYALGKLRHESPFPGEDIGFVQQTMRVVFLLVGAHLILLFPYIIGQFVLNYAKTAPGYLPKWKVNFSLISGWIWYSSPLLFPFLYRQALEDFREGIADTITNIGKLRITYSSLASPSNPFKPAQQV